MLDVQSGAYTKTGAYNLLKGFLGIPKKSTINRDFFKLFFWESDGFYLIKKPETKVESMFKEKGIPSLNRLYYKLKTEGHILTAKDAQIDIINICQDAMFN